MARYVIGDVQGCLAGLQRLLCEINYQPGRDSLWFAGDLVNRGPDSLGVLKFIYNQPDVRVVLGNHDLHLLAIAAGVSHRYAADMAPILQDSQAKVLLSWLHQQPLMWFEQKVLMVHAGLYPGWTMSQALSYVDEIHDLLKRDESALFLSHMYGDQPSLWSESLTGWPRLRFITNACVRMRFVDAVGHCDFQYSMTPGTQPDDLMPWYEHPNMQWPEATTVAFGHWAALKAKVEAPHLQALDGGYVWGLNLVAWCPETGERFSVAAA